MRNPNYKKRSLEDGHTWTYSSLSQTQMVRKTHAAMSSFLLRENFNLKKGQFIYFAVQLFKNLKLGFLQVTLTN